MHTGDLRLLAELLLCPRVALAVEPREHDLAQLALTLRRRFELGLCGHREPVSPSQIPLLTHSYDRGQYY